MCGLCSSWMASGSSNHVSYEGDFARGGEDRFEVERRGKMSRSRAILGLTAAGLDLGGKVSVDCVRCQRGLGGLEWMGWGIETIEKDLRS